MFSEHLFKLVHSLGERLKSQELYLATAESCTGGGLAYLLTSVPGSSDWFDRGWVTYSNLSKISLLGVSEETLKTEGAVSEKTAIAMAEGGLQRSIADIVLSITGIAGPSGGTKDKPVGTVCFAIVKRKAGIQSFQRNFKEKSRFAVRERAMETILKEALESSLF